MVNRKWFFALTVIAGLLVFFWGCEKKTATGKVEVTDYELTVRQDSPHSFVLDAKGKVKNVGEVDVRKVEVTGYCRSCGEVFTSGHWFVSEYEKTADQKDIISYLTAGTEEDFAFKGVAFYFTQSGQAPENHPEDIDIVIESFEVAEE